MCVAWLQQYRPAEWSRNLGWSLAVVLVWFPIWSLRAVSLCLLSGNVICALSLVSGWCDSCCLMWPSLASLWTNIFKVVQGTSESSVKNPSPMNSRRQHLMHPCPITMSSDNVWIMSENLKIVYIVITAQWKCLIGRRETISEIDWSLPESDMLLLSMLCMKAMVLSSELTCM